MNLRSRQRSHKKFCKHICISCCITHPSKQTWKTNKT